MQSSTVALFNSFENTTYSPMIPFQANDPAEIALDHGYLYRWSCAHISGLDS